MHREVGDPFTGAASQTIGNHDAEHFQHGGVQSMTNHGPQIDVLIAIRRLLDNLKCERKITWPVGWQNTLGKNNANRRLSAGDRLRRCSARTASAVGSDPHPPPLPSTPQATPMRPITSIVYYASPGIWIIASLWCLAGDDETTDHSPSSAAGAAAYSASSPGVSSLAHR